MGWDRLYVIWREPQTGRRHCIGELWRINVGYAFGYNLTECPWGNNGHFDILPEFPDTTRSIENPYTSKHLFPTFSQRIPSPKRPDFDKLMHLWGVESPDDALEILGVSGGMQATDQLELADYRTIDDDLSRPLIFRLAGAQHYPHSEAVHTGEHLQLRRDYENQYDRYATKVEAAHGIQIGWVPRQYSELVATRVEMNIDLTLVILRRLPLVSEKDRWLLHLSRSSG